MSSPSFCASDAARLAFATGALAFTVAADAQTPESIRERARSAPDLSFSEPKTLRFYSSLPNSVFKPEGSGPFPAIVQIHTCGGVYLPHARSWAEAAVERGYVVLVLDSLGPRSVTTVCDTIPAYGKGGVSIFRGVKDAFDAKAHLAKLAFVDPQRISLVGFSWGGMVGNLAAAKAFTEAFTDKPFTSVVSFYPGCHYHYFPDDIQTPLLVLMGEEDNEVDVPSCVSRLERLRERHAPVQWRVYPGATHSWDWDVEVNKLAFGGKPVRYVPNARVKRDSTEHLFQFLALP